MPPDLAFDNPAFPQKNAAITPQNATILFGVRLMSLLPPPPPTNGSANATARAAAKLPRKKKQQATKWVVGGTFVVWCIVAPLLLVIGSLLWLLHKGRGEPSQFDEEIMAAVASIEKAMAPRTNGGGGKQKAKRS